MNAPNLAYADDVATLDEIDVADLSDSALSAEERERLALIEEVRRSEEHYARTGLHLTWEEVREWLFAYGTPDEKGMPECHT